MVSDFSLTFEIQYIITKERLLEAFNYNDKVLASSMLSKKYFLNNVSFQKSLDYKKTLILANVNSITLNVLEYQCTWKRIQNKGQTFLIK